MTYKVIIRGWAAQKEVLPISLMRLLQEHCALSLPQAKAALDDFAENGLVYVTVEDRAKADKLIEGAIALGADCQLDAQQE